MIFKVLLILAVLAGCTSVRKPASSDFIFKEIKPAECNPLATAVNGAHVAYWNPSVSNGKLIISTGGTGSKAIDFLEFARVATSLGYHMISVDYPNRVITTECRESNNRKCFDQFREEIVLGHPVSDIVDVNSNNSVENRIRSLLSKLAMDDPARWGEFFKKGDVIWRNVITVGNSQGAGHAAYLGKLYSVERVIMIAGPQDHFMDSAAPWVSKPGKTPGSRYYALLHRDDYYDSKKQTSVYHQLCACQDLKRVIISNKPAEDTHNVLLWPPYRDEWAQLLRLDP